jgi:hypothetical protein
MVRAIHASSPDREAASRGGARGRRWRPLLLLDTGSLQPPPRPRTECSRDETRHWHRSLDANPNRGHTCGRLSPHPRRCARPGDRIEGPGRFGPNPSCVVPNNRAATGRCACSQPTDRPAAAFSRDRAFRETRTRPAADEAQACAAAAGRDSRRVTTGSGGVVAPPGCCPPTSQRSDAWSSLKRGRRCCVPAA